MLAAISPETARRKCAWPWHGNSATGARRKKRGGRLLFVNQKKQKNFIELDRAGDGATGPSAQKGVAFLQEAPAPASCAGKPAPSQPPHLVARPEASRGNNA